MLFYARAKNMALRDFEAFQALATAFGDCFADVNRLGEFAFAVCSGDFGARIKTSRVVDDVDAGAWEVRRRLSFGGWFSSLETRLATRLRNATRAAP